MHCCDSYAVRRESRERWDFNYKDYSFASLLKAKTVAVINRVTCHDTIIYRAAFGLKIHFSKS